MDLKEIIAITGKPGLFKIIARSPKGLVVESLDEKKTKMSVSTSYQIAVLDEITIYHTGTEELYLRDIFEKIKEKSPEGILPVKVTDDSLKLKTFFKEVAEGYDEDRVYVSDMKKVFKWYEILSAHDLL